MKNTVGAAALLPGVVIAISLVLPGAAFAQNSRPQQNRSAQRVSAEDLSDNPQNYYGKTVTVKEDVEHVLGPNLFTLDDGEFLGSSPDILVFAPNAEAMPRVDGTVTVTGDVRMFTVADLEREYGWGWGAYPWGAGYYGYPWYDRALRPDYFVRYRNRPVIVASSIVTGMGVQLVSNGSGNGSGAVGTSGTASSTVTDLSSLTSSSATQMAGRDVRLMDVKVGRVTGERGFWAAAPNGKNVFVALDEDIRKPDLHEGDHVTVAGNVQKTPRDRNRIDARMPPEAPVLQRHRRGDDARRQVGDLPIAVAGIVGRRDLRHEAAVAVEQDRRRLRRDQRSAEPTPDAGRQDSRAARGGDTAQLSSHRPVR